MWQTIDVVHATGLPVREHMVYMVGTLQSAGKVFQFSEHSVPMQMQPKHYLQLDQPVDPWYFHVRPENIFTP